MYSLYCFDFAVSLYFINWSFHLEKEACTENVSIYSYKNIVIKQQIKINTNKKPKQTLFFIGIFYYFLMYTFIIPGLGFFSKSHLEIFQIE